MNPDYINKPSDYSKYMTESDSDISTTDIKINPDYYIHFSLVALQKSLDHNDINEAVFSYILKADHFETLSRSFERMPKDFDDRVEEYKKSDEYVNEEDGNIKRFRLARKKVQFILSNIGDQRVIIDKLKM